MGKKILLSLLICLISFSLFADKVIDTAQVQVTLDTTGIEYFECGFTADPNPTSPINLQGISTYSIGAGGIEPAKEIKILSKKIGGHLEIASEVYTIWALKIGIRNVQLSLNATPLTFNKINIPYELYVHKTNPETVSSPNFKVVNKAVDYIIPSSEMDGHFIKFWTTKFMIKVPGLPANIEAGTYSGTLTLTITSI